MFQWLLSGIAIAVALIALAKARRLAKRLERLTESYWELRYESGQLKARVARLEAAVGPMGAGAEPDVVGPRVAGPASFIPLSSLKK